MIRIHRSTNAGLESIEHPVNGCWIEVSNPGPAEKKSLTLELGIPQEFVNFSLDPDEVPLIEKDKGALLVLARIPRFQGATAPVPYVTLPMGFVVTEDRVVTICRLEHNLLQHLPHEHQADLSTLNPARFVLHFLWSAANGYLHHLNDINKTVEKVEERVGRSLQNREVLDLLRYQKSLIHFTTALRANEMMLERLQRSKLLPMEQSDEDLMDDVFTETRQAIVMSQIASDILGQMMDAFATIVSNNLNGVMKFLTSMAMILIIPTIIGTFYGMNISLPLMDSESAFVLLVGISILISLLVGMIFWKKDWL